MASKIFLAYAREDQAQVRKLHADLRARGFEPWLDKVDLLPGQIWEIEIAKAIRQAGVFLACLSSRSVGKIGYVQSEFRLALSAFGQRPAGTIFLIPVRLDDCEVPDLQNPDLGLRLRAIHWVDLWEENGVDRLVKAIEHALGVSFPQASRKELPRPDDDLIRDALNAYLWEFWVTNHSDYRYARKSAQLDTFRIGNVQPFYDSKHGRLPKINWGSPVYPVEAQYILITKTGEVERMRSDFVCYMDSFDNWRCRRVDVLPQRVG